MRKGFHIAFIILASIFVMGCANSNKVEESLAETQALAANSVVVYSCVPPANHAVHGTGLFVTHFRCSLLPPTIAAVMRREHSIYVMPSKLEIVLKSTQVEPYRLGVRGKLAVFRDEEWNLEEVAEDGAILFVRDETEYEQILDALERVKNSGAG